MPEGSAGVTVDEVIGEAAFRSADALAFGGPLAVWNGLMQTEGKSRKLLRIHPGDNVLIVVTPIRCGDRDVIDGREVVFGENVAIGHKIAARAIQVGEKIVKCGVPIGSATRALAAGEHVHLHNLKSDYIATYTLDNDHVFVK